MTPSDGSKTWGRSAVCKKEDLATNKKKGRTWGPSSTHQRERVGGEEKYVDASSFTIKCFLSLTSLHGLDFFFASSASIKAKSEKCEMLKI